MIFLTRLLLVYKTETFVRIDERTHQMLRIILMGTMINQKGYYLRNRNKGKSSCCNSSQDD
jgi:hypothetical protein